MIDLNAATTSHVMKITSMNAPIDNHMVIKRTSITMMVIIDKEVKKIIIDTIVVTKKTASKMISLKDPLKKIQTLVLIIKEVVKEDQVKYRMLKRNLSMFQ